MDHSRIRGAKLEPANVLQSFHRDRYDEVPEHVFAVGGQFVIAVHPHDKIGRSQLPARRRELWQRGRVGQFTWRHALIDPPPNDLTLPITQMPRVRELCLLDIRQERRHVSGLRDFDKLSASLTHFVKRRQWKRTNLPIAMADDAMLVH